MVAAIGEQILGPTDVSLSNWTAPAAAAAWSWPHTLRVSVDGYTLTLAANLWNIVRTYNLTPGQELLFACRYRLGGLQLRGVHVQGRQRLRPIVRQLRGRPGRLEHGQDVLHSSCASGRTSRRRGCPTRRQERWTFTASRSWTQPWRPATSAYSNLIILVFWSKNPAKQPNSPSARRWSTANSSPGRRAQARAHGEHALRPRHLQLREVAAGRRGGVPHAGAGQGEAEGASPGGRTPRWPGAGGLKALRVGDTSHPHRFGLSSNQWV